MNKTIKGQLIDVSKNDTLNYLVLALNKSHVELILNAVRKSKHNYIVYCDGFDFSECELPNVCYINDYENLLSVALSINKVITLIGFLNKNLPLNFVNILSVFIKMKKPIIEFPHGLFQLGYNLIDDSKYIDLSSCYYGGNKLIKSIACEKLNWFGADGVGYPRNNFSKIKTKIVPKYTVVTTNTNWYLYSIVDKRNFFTILFEFVKLSPEKLFIWTPHPAERNESSYAKLMDLTKPTNLLIYGLQNEIYFDSIDNTEDVIRYAQEGIATVGTCLLDFEYHQIPVSVFECEGVKSLIDTFEMVTVFSTLSELQNTRGKIITGYLKDFDVDLFDKLLLEANYRHDEERIFTLEAFRY